MRLVTVGHLGKKNEQREKKNQRGGGKEKISLLTFSWWAQHALRHLMEKFRKY